MKRLSFQTGFVLAGLIYSGMAERQARIVAETDPAAAEALIRFSETITRDAMNRARANPSGYPSPE